MFFPLSKLLYFLVTPSNALTLLVLAGIGLAAAGWLRLGLLLGALGSILLVTVGFTPLAGLVALPLEERFPAHVADDAPVAGIIVLGGAIETRTSAERGQLVVNDAGERQIAMADLARRYPQSRLVFTGGSGSLNGSIASEAEIVGRYAETMGLPRTRLILEDRSRNTRENSVFSAALVKPKPGERWLLVTSAWHMPRAVGCFRQAGFTVTAYPVDYRTNGWSDALRFNGFASDGLMLLDLMVKEWLGLVAYRLAGYTDALLPAPQSASASSEVAETAPSR
ncbi:YdcF family protein [Methylobacterium sp. J-078]|uniref:YdcF family protein n=1 Tax=Methylobacterium sp. J-078 TaxID=2836657 RepID=UPI001FB95473|nr:YdcF family protein [Methylobacterium sp. J-078]MCJ2044227.1 YdcF family protein [Methylobacterium sp. J-078]